MRNAATILVPAPKSFAYGSILGRDSFDPDSERSEDLPALGACLFQGVAAGVLVISGFFIYAATNFPLRYWGLMIPAFPSFVGVGLYFGAGPGLAICIASTLMRRPLGFLARLAVGSLATGLLLWAAQKLMSLAPPENWSDLLRGSLFVCLIAATAALPIDFLGLLIRDVGSKSSLANLVGCVLGVVLRLTVTAGLVLTSYSFIILLRLVMLTDVSQRDVVVDLLLLSHFVLSFITVFLRLRFIPLVILSTVATFPVAAYIFDTQSDWPLFIQLTTIYFIIWGLYVLTHSPIVGRTIEFLKKE